VEKDIDGDDRLVRGGLDDQQQQVIEVGKCDRIPLVAELVHVPQLDDDGAKEVLLVL
jgi:hypothetical protein